MDPFPCEERLTGGIGDKTMKIYALLLATPLALGSGSRTTQNLDGSMTTDRSKTVRTPDADDTTTDSTTVITR
jgi:hypothetical protein